MRLFLEVFRNSISNSITMLKKDLKNKRFHVLAIFGSIFALGISLIVVSLISTQHKFTVRLLFFVFGIFLLLIGYRLYDFYFGRMPDPIRIYDYLSKAGFTLTKYRVGLFKHGFYKDVYIKLGIFPTYHSHIHLCSPLLKNYSTKKRSKIKVSNGLVKVEGNDTIFSELVNFSIPKDINLEFGLGVVDGYLAGHLYLPDPSHDELIEKISDFIEVFVMIRDKLAKGRERPEFNFEKAVRVVESFELEPIV